MGRPATAAIVGSPLVSKHESFGWLLRLFLAAAKAVVVLYLILDAIFTPLVRPLYKWLINLRYVIRFQDAIAALPPYGILATLAVPFAFAEPAKLVALYLIAAGHLRAGIILTLVAHLVTLVIVERIYHAGREKLRTIRWFAAIMDWLTGVSDRFLAWARTTWAWTFSVKVKRRAGVLVARLKHRFRAVLRRQL
jgi:hypothetical protein